jgi:DNA-binding transcriptional MerR regulator
MPAMARDTQASLSADAQAFLDAHRADDGDVVYGITDLVNEFGVTARAIRLYEEKGLLAPRRVGTARIYSRRERARLALILRAKALGSSLEEIHEYLELYGQHGEGRKQQLEFVVRKTTQKLAELEEKRAQIDATVAELVLIRRVCEEQLQRRRGG